MKTQNLTSVEGPQAPPDVERPNLNTGGREAIGTSQWVETYGDLLFRFAMGRVSRHEAAEDLVQETLLAAWQSRDRFKGRSSHKTWLLRILKNKIVDYYRRTSREVELDGMDELAAFGDQQFETGRLGSAHWERSVAPRGWSHPTKSVENAEFWATVRDCTGRLPERTAQVFVLREMDGLRTEEICQALNVKQSHLFVMLHRARLAMRRCLELNWFRNPPRPTKQRH